MLLDLLSQIEPDDSWRSQWPDPFPRPAALAPYPAVSYVANLDIAITGHAGPSGYLRAGTQRQYLPSVAPLFTGTATTVALDWDVQREMPQPAPARPPSWLAWTPSSDALTAWAAIYPDPQRLVPALPSGSTSLLAPNDSTSGWWPIYPVWLARTVALLDSPLAIDPFPYPAVTVTLLSAWGVYPDRLDRATLLTALMPTFTYGTLVPIPNPTVTLVIEDRILLGQNTSLDVPFYPSIGSSTTWS